MVFNVHGCCFTKAWAWSNGGQSAFTCSLNLANDVLIMLFLDLLQLQLKPRFLRRMDSSLDIIFSWPFQLLIFWEVDRRRASWGVVWELTMVVLKWSLKKHTGCLEQFTRIVRTNLHQVVINRWCTDALELQFPEIADKDSATTVWR